MVILAAGSIMGSFRSIDLHTGIHDGSVKEDRDLMGLVGSLDPVIISILDRSLSGRIVKSFGFSGIVYDLSAIRYFGSCNDLASTAITIIPMAVRRRSTSCLQSQGIMAYRFITESCQETLFLYPR